MNAVLNVSKNNDVADISIVGDIGYNFWADTYEEYKANTSAEKAKQLNELKDLGVKTINLTIESFGGDVPHALAIYNIFRQTDATLNVFLRGANASSATIIASAAKVENIKMDNIGLYLIHKPMTSAWGNQNDLEASKKDLDKWQKSIEQAYLNLGVKQEVLDDLMERNGGHGEWLTYNEAKEYGFVGGEWEAKSVSNYKAEDFKNKGYLIPKNILSQKTKKMSEINEETKKGLFAEFKNWIKGEQEQETLANVKNELQVKNDALEDAMAENEALKAKVAELEAKIAELEATENVEEEEEEELEKKEVQTIENKVSAIVAEQLKAIVEPITNSAKKVQANENEPFWKKHLSYKNQ